MCVSYWSMQLVCRSPLKKRPVIDPNLNSSVFSNSIMGTVMDCQKIYFLKWAPLFVILWWSEFSFPWTLHARSSDYVEGGLFLSLFSSLTPAISLFSIPTSPITPPSCFQQHSTSPLRLKWASFYGNHIQQHIVPLSDFIRWSISDDVVTSRQTLQRCFQWQHECVSVCVCVCVWSIFDTSTLIWGWRILRFFFLLLLRVRDGGRLEVLESPLLSVWEAWMAAGCGKQVEMKSAAFSMKSGWKG